jgi:hypothetical protein
MVGLFVASSLSLIRVFVFANSNADREHNSTCGLENRIVRGRSPAHRCRAGHTIPARDCCERGGHGQKRPRNRASCTVHGGRSSDILGSNSDQFNHSAPALGRSRTHFGCCGDCNPICPGPAFSRNEDLQVEFIFSPTSGYSMDHRTHLFFNSALALGHEYKKTDLKRQQEGNGDGIRVERPKG